MQQLSNLPSQNNPSTDLANLSQKATAIFKSLNPEVKCLLASFPSKDKQSVYPSLHSACEDDSSPALTKIDAQYGNNTSIIWLSVQLIQIATFTGICEKLRWEQLEETARNFRSMSAEFGVTLAEMMVFFSRFEQGYYQQFIGYERPNPQVITKSFRFFLEDDLISTRVKIHEAKERERRDLERAEAKANATPMPDNIAKRLTQLYNKTDINHKDESKD